MELRLDNPWDVSEEDFPRQGMPQEKLRFLLNYAVLAPSGHNTQPWIFRITGDEVELYADRSRTLPVIDPQDRELMISCGAALFHLRAAARHYGYQPVVRTFPDLGCPDLLATVRLGRPGEPSLEDHQVFMAIKKRHTNRMPFEDRPIPEAELVVLQEAARQEGAALHVFAEGKRKNDLTDLISEGDRLQVEDKQFRRELAAWVQPNWSARKDGIPGYAHGVGDLLSYAGPLVVRTFVWGKGQAARDRQLAEGSPALMVLSTDRDHPIAWLDAGQALARVLLLAADAGLSASFLNQPIEVPALRPRLAGLLGEGRHPQLILRMGYGEAVKATPRRPVSEVLAVARPA